MHANHFIEIAAILGLCTVLGAVGQKLRQPLLIMFLAAGILAGPSFFGIIADYQQIELLAHMGIALLLFIVGLRLDVNLIRTTGPVALATGLGQIVFTFLIGFGIAVVLGMSIISAAYVAVALTFSSTIIIVKLLSDKKEIDSLHGQIAVGFLIVQDIAAIIALVLLTTFGASVQAQEGVFQTAVVILVKGFGLLGMVFLLMKYVLPPLARHLAHAQELFVLFAIAWAVFLGAAGEWLGFSKEVGAFLAGISLASTGYRESLGARLTTLRDFLLLFFFIDLGARLDFAAVGSHVGDSIVLSLFVLIGNPLIVMAIMGVMGYRRRTGFLAGLTVAQISEFSLIVAALGLSLGHITDQTMGLITLVGVITIFASTYLILYSGPIYRLLSPLLRIFERRNPYREAAFDTQSVRRSADVILIGLGNYGSSVAECLLRRNKTILGVDFDPVSLEKWAARGISVLYGDVADPEIHEQLPLAAAQWIVSTVRSREMNLALLQQLKTRGYPGRVAVAATRLEEVDEYRAAGAKVVFRPFADAAEQAVDALTYAMEFMPKDIDWPISFREVRIRSDASVAGHRIIDIPLRPQTRVSILAVSRAGRVHYHPAPDYQVYPGDRLLIMGSVEELRQAESLLTQSQHAEADQEDPAYFALAEIGVAEGSALEGRTLAEIQFRQTYAVTVVGIRRGEDRIVTPASSERLAADDSLIVIGECKAVERLKQKAPI